MSEIKKLGVAAAGMGALAAVVLISLAIIDGYQDTYVDSTYHCGLNSTNGTSGTLLYDGCAQVYHTGTYLKSGITIFGSFAAVVVLAIVGRLIIKLFSKD